MSDAKLVWYDHNTMKLQGSIKGKAERFVKLDLIEQINNTNWKVKAIKGYNKQDYIVTNKGFDWHCNCQSKLEVCSHALAVIYYMRGYI